MPEIRGRATGALDWRAYYEREVELRRFVPEQEPYEEHRVRFVMRLLGGLRPARILDVGCGDGYLCGRYAGAGVSPSIRGLDISTGRLRYAARVHEGGGRPAPSGARFIAGRIDRLPFSDDSFPLVSAVEVIEHIEDPISTLREIARVSSAHVIVTVPNEQVPAQALCPSCLHRFPVDGHLHTFTLPGLIDICRKAGLEPVPAERYHVPAGWEARGPFRWMGSRGRRLSRRAMVAAGLLGEPRAKYIGVLCEKPGSAPARPPGRA
jgi:2-polyprenyl-3-methyl-5-hydroxy-6-metoxy-1,4-benzoquinol methylase